MARKGVKMASRSLSVAVNEIPALSSCDGEQVRVSSTDGKAPLPYSLDLVAMLLESL